MPKAVVVLSLILNLVFTFNARSQDVKKTKVFLLAGQSNMDGRGAASGLTKYDLKQLAFAKKRIHFYYKGNVNNGSSGTQW